MSANVSGPRVIFGAPLAERRWVKQVHIDEAGTSAREPKAVVAAAIIDADNQYRDVEQRIADTILEFIPAHMRDGFVFHAKDVFGKYKKREGWTIARCNEITDAWLRIALDLSIPVQLAWIWKNQNEAGVCEVNEEAHTVVFAQCIQSVDDFMREEYPNEIASLVAEDCPQMRAKLRHMLQKVRSGALIGEWGFDHPITTIKNGLYFADKAESPLLQIADAYAFAFKRYITKSSGGQRFWMTMNGNPPMLLQPDFIESGGGTLVIHKPSGSPLIFGSGHR